jgi:hypothetical protein
MRFAKPRCAYLLMTILVLGGCFSAAPSGAGLADDVELVAPSMLNENPLKFDGKTVRVQGYLILGPEAHIFYESKELSEEVDRLMKPPVNGNFDLKKFRKYCVTIINADFFESNRDALNGKSLVLLGVFKSTYLTGNEIDLGACPLRTGILVDIENLKRRYPELFLK